MPRKNPSPTWEPLWTAAEARAMDAWSIQELKVPGIVLMEHAGRAVAEHVLRIVEGGTRPALVLAGPGNNGGDGWVCARHLWGRGIAAPVLALRAPADLTGDAAEAAGLFERASRALSWRAPGNLPPWMPLTSADDLRRAVVDLSPALVVDALFGTGLGRPLTGIAADVVDTLNELALPILAVDLPSGLPTDGDAPQGPAVHAQWTVTFAGRKIAHACEPGRFFCGDVTDIDIGVWPSTKLRDDVDVFRAPPLPALWTTSADARAHKGSFGHVAVLAGAPRTAGAARLAAKGALHAGAGLVSILVDDPAAHAAADVPELMHRDARADDALAGIDAVVLGPGLGRDPASLARGRKVLMAARDGDLPVVIDADALPLLFENGPPVRAIATPHPGETAHLLSSSTKDVQAHRLLAARELHRRSQAHRVTWILKGACPIVVEQSGRAIVCEGGAVALAVGGSGDVLSGVLGALLARGCSTDEAALVGTVAHQEAGRRLTKTASRGHLASRIAEEVQWVLYQEVLYQQVPHPGDGK